MTTVALYTPEVLALATSLADFAWDDALPLKGGARSRSCGSSIDLGMSTDAAGRVDRVVAKSHACAIGQAAAAIFAGGAQGRTGQEIRASHEAMKAWLAGDEPIPDWPGLDAIAAARDYPGRHGAILLSWQAASQMLSTD